MYRYEGTVANRALELLGRELGMFAGQSEPAFEWDGDPSKLSEAQTKQLMAMLERLAFNNDPEAIAAARAEALAGLDRDAIQ